MQEYAGGPLPWALLESIQMFTAMGLWEPPFGCMGMHTDLTWAMDRRKNFKVYDTTRSRFQNCGTFLNGLILVKPILDLLPRICTSDIDVGRCRWKS